MPAAVSGAVNQLPALRRLYLRLNASAFVEEVLPVVPAGIIFLEIIYMDMDQLEEALALIAHGDWFNGSLERIVLDLEYLDTWIDLSSNQPYFNGQEWSKKELVDAAEKAVLAALEANVTLRPEDLVERIAELWFWPASE